MAIVTSNDYFFDLNCVKNIALFAIDQITNLQTNISVIENDKHAYNQINPKILGLVLDLGPELI